LLAVLLNARGAQASKAVLIDGILPGQEFLDRQRIACAGLFQRQQATAHRGDHLSLAADDPAFRRRRRQVRNREGAAIGPDDVFDPRAVGLGHWCTHRTLLDWHLLVGSYSPRLKICLSIARSMGNVCPVSANLLVTI